MVFAAEETVMNSIFYVVAVVLVVIFVARYVGLA